MFGDHQYFYFTLLGDYFNSNIASGLSKIIEKQQNGEQFAKTFPYSFVRRVIDSMSLAWYVGSTRLCQHAQVIRISK